VPPLRVRLSDVVALANYFLAEAGRHRGQAPKTLSRPAVLRLESYKYPNNIAQLRAIVDRAASQTDGNLIPESVLWFAAQVIAPYSELLRASPNNSLARQRRVDVLGSFCLLSASCFRPVPTLLSISPSSPHLSWCPLSLFPHARTSVCMQPHVQPKHKHIGKTCW
jgi:hypothetical protein